MDTIYIKQSKKKLLMIIAGTCLFIVLGILFIVIPNTFSSFLIKNTSFIRIIGIGGVFFFGFILVTILKKFISDKNLGIIINKDGIIDNSSFVSVGLIKWEDIISIEKREVLSSKFLLIFVKEPEKYIDKNKNNLKLKLRRANYNSYGTPISISSNSVSYDFNELEKVIRENLEKHNQQ